MFYIFPLFKRLISLLLIGLTIILSNFFSLSTLLFSVHVSFLLTTGKCRYCVFSTSKVSEEQRRLRREKDEIQTDRQTVYREETRIAHELNNLRDELARTEHNLRSITGKGILNGLDSVRKVSNCHIFLLHGL